MIKIFISVSPNNFNIVFEIINAIARRNHVRIIVAPSALSNSLIVLKFDDNNLQYAENAYVEIQRIRYVKSVSLIINNEDQTFENLNEIEYGYYDNGEEKEDEDEDDRLSFNMNDSNNGFCYIQ
jgi:hypothetical protein